MKKIKTFTALLIGSALLFVSSAFIRPNPAATGSEILIIVNKENPVSSMDAGQVKLYWLRKVKKRWPELNKNIRPADRKSKCAERELFYGKVLNMSDDEVETYFVTKQYQNAEKPQDKFGGDAEILDFVASEPGAIGFINASSFTGSSKEKVKSILSVQ